VTDTKEPIHTMRIFRIDLRLPDFKKIAGLTALETEIQKFRVLRDSYREANRAHYGEYLASLLDE
jgi:hypothetical protein